MHHYVLVVPLSADLKQVVTILKNRGPVGVAHRVNFPGGHVEPGEEYDDAAARELREESGLVVPPTALRLLAIKVGVDYELRTFVAYLPSVADAQSLTEEPISITSVANLMTDWLMDPDHYGPDFMTLLALALDTRLPRNFVSINA